MIMLYKTICISILICLISSCASESSNTKSTPSEIAKKETTKTEKPEAATNPGGQIAAISTITEIPMHVKRPCCTYSQNSGGPIMLIVGKDNQAIMELDGKRQTLEKTGNTLKNEEYTITIKTKPDSNDTSGRVQNGHLQIRGKNGGLMMVAITGQCGV